MTTTPHVEVWFGVLGLIAGATLLVAGLFVNSDKPQTEDNGIAITIVRVTPSR